MNLVILIKIISSISFCCSLEANNKTEESEISTTLRQKRNNDNLKLRLDLTNIILPKITRHKTNKIESNGRVLLRQRRMQPSVPKNENNLNNGNIKLHLDLNNLLPKISLQRQNIMQQPITNIRVRPRPVVLANNRVNAFNKGKSKPNVCHPVKSITATKPIPLKTNEEMKPTISPTKNITNFASEPTKAKFYLETDDQDEIYIKPDSVTPKSPLETRVKETVLTKLKEECSDEKKDKNDVIIGLMKELPDIIKTVLAERVKSEGNPIIFKNITEITLPIQRGEITNNQVSNKNDKTGNVSTRTNNRHSQEVMDLLLKPILKAKQNKAEVSYIPLQVSSTKNSENGAESIDIKQNNYSEIVERKHEPIVINKLEGNKQPVEEELHVTTFTKSLCKNQNPVQNFSPNVYNSDSMYKIPGVQETTLTVNPNVYNTGPIYATSADVYPNLYTPNALYMKSPYEYSQYLHSYNLDGTPKYSTVNKTNNVEPYGFDDTKWKTWSNTEIVIKTNNNHVDLQNQRPTLMQNQGYPKNYNGYNNNCYQNQFTPMYSGYPCYVFPGLCLAY